MQEDREEKQDGHNALQSKTVQINEAMAAEAGLIETIDFEIEKPVVLQI